MINKYLLDTNICIFMLKNRYNIRTIINDNIVDNCYISELSIAELYYGAYKSICPDKGIKEVQLILSRFKTIPVSDSLALFGQLKAEMERNGNKIDDFDLFIGATAIAHDLIMVTDNVKHLGKIPGIQTENWVERE